MKPHPKAYEIELQSRIEQKFKNHSTTELISLESYWTSVKNDCPKATDELQKATNNFITHLRIEIMRRTKEMCPDLKEAHDTWIKSTL